MVDLDLLRQFLEEAGELFEGLDEKLIELEVDSGNKELLNDIFRAFHTIKGGAGFLDLKPMVDLCHRCEDIFDQIRGGLRHFSSDTMDTFSAVIDQLGDYFDALHNGNYSLEYPLELIAELDKLLGQKSNDDSPTSVLFENSNDEKDVELDEMEALFESIKSPPKPESTSFDADDLMESLFEENKTAPPVNASFVDTESNSYTNADDKQHANKVDKNTNKPRKELSVVRVETNKIDDIMNLVGELVLNRNRLVKVAAELGSPELSRGIATLDFITTELQSGVMKTRMQPVKRVFQRFPKMVRDIGRSLGKTVRLEMVGEDTELDKNLVDALSDPMIHMVRNSVDHGIETSEQRLRKGKPEEGVVVLKAEQLGDHVEIKISDDGKGVDAQEMRNKAVEKGLISEDAANSMTDNEALQLIFMPGFSTAEKVTDLSGRGVGMDVVKTTVERLNGFIAIDSKVGFGSTFTLKIPLTMAILQTLMVEVGTQSYAIPLPGTSEIFFYDETKVNVIEGQSFSRLREGSVPIFYLEDVLPPETYERPEGKTKKVVVVTIGDKMAGIVVDDVLGQEEVVIKPMGAFLNELSDYAGATITGDGRVALILDINKLVKLD